MSDLAENLMAEEDVLEAANFPPAEEVSGSRINLARKRAFDLVLGSIILILLSPILLLSPGS